MRFSLHRLLVFGAGAFCLLGGCAHHPHKIKSYDRSISNDDDDPTYRDNPERADVEVRDDTR